MDWKFAWNDSISLLFDYYRCLLYSLLNFRVCDALCACLCKALSISAALEQIISILISELLLIHLNRWHFGPKGSIKCSSFSYHHLRLSILLLKYMQHFAQPERNMDLWLYVPSLSRWHIGIQTLIFLTLPLSLSFAVFLDVTSHWLVLVIFINRDQI